MFFRPFYKGWTMVRRNYSRAEKGFERIAEAYEKDRLLKEADLADLSKGGSEAKKINNVSKMLQALHKDLIVLSRRDKKAYESIGITEDQILVLIKDPARITPGDWQVLRKVKREVDKCKDDLTHARKKSTKKIVEKERKKQAGRHFNVKDGWDPV